jgi:anthranilate phosphoribosyltransferase
MAAPPTSRSPDPVAHALARLASGGRLTEDEVSAAFAVLMSGEGSAERAAALLMGMRVQGESGVEVAGAARALRAVMRRVNIAAGPPIVDTAGTGGGKIGTFNVSTAAAIVAAGAGVRVAKHGNRSYTSQCGSADVLEALRVDLRVHADHAPEVLARVGMVFLFAPSFHPAMRHLAPVRRELGVPTVMNLVGPLVNPAGVRRQVIGVGDASRAPVIADALRRLDCEHGLVVHATVGMDEIAPAGRTRVWEVRGTSLRESVIEPVELGASWPTVDALRGGSPAENAARIERLLGAPSEDPAGRAATVLNAAAALYVAGACPAMRDGVALATEALESGRAAKVLEGLREGLSIGEARR